MNNSGSTTRSAPSALALSRATRALAALPVTSPTVGFSWASEIVNLGSVMGRWCLALEQTANARFIAFSSEANIGSHSSQVYADCVDLSAQKTRQNNILDMRF